MQESIASKSGATRFFQLFARKTDLSGDKWELSALELGADEGSGR